MSQNLLQKRFLNLIRRYSQEENYNDQCWVEIINHYTREDRYYHNIIHLKNLLLEFDGIREEITKPDVVLFAIFYHDIIYQPAKSDNEHKSALFFKKAISPTNFPFTEECMKMIERSKDHYKSSDSDCNFFLDMDLSILGQERNKYMEYCKNIRKEFSIVSDEVYRKERKKVLKKFLEWDRIFKSDFFNKKYEEKARGNIRFELKNLSELPV